MSTPQSLIYDSDATMSMSIGKATSRYVDLTTPGQALATLLICALLAIAVAVTGASQLLQLTAAATAGVAIVLAVLVGYIVWHER